MMKHFAYILVKGYSAMDVLVRGASTNVVASLFNIRPSAAHDSQSREAVGNQWRLEERKLLTGVKSWDKWGAGEIRCHNKPQCISANELQILAQVIIGDPG